jgi:hypothetical protein
VKSKEYRNLSWITAKKSRKECATEEPQPGVIRSYTFRLALRQPEIALESGDVAVVLSMETAEYSSHEKLSKVERDFKTSHMILATRCDNREAEFENVSLLESDNVLLKTRNCNAGERASSSVKPAERTNFCYNVSHLDGEWRDVSRLMILSS